MLTTVPEFFYRFDCLHLISGNKAAGFRTMMSTDVLKQLCAMPVSEEQHIGLLKQIRERVLRAKLLPKILAKTCGVSLLNNSACPAFFTTNPMFGGSIGADPFVLGLISDPSTDAAVLAQVGPSVDFTPHNVDAPLHALALVVMIETWAEWAYDEFLLPAAHPWPKAIASDQ